MSVHKDEAGKRWVQAEVIVPGTPHQALLRLSSPAPGIVHVFAMPMGPQLVVSIRCYLYGETAAHTVELQEPVWRDWMNRLLRSTGAV